MKTKSLISTVFVLFLQAALFAAGKDDTSKQLQIFPKNLARQNVGSNLFIYNASNQTYVPTEASAAWLDDDIATGWPPAAGHSYYLLSLSEAQLVTNFALSARSGEGTINLFAGDQPAAPGSKSWTLVAKGVSVESINDKKMSQPFSRFAKYFLIETNIENPVPWYSLYLFGEKPAVAYNIESRAQQVDTRSLFGPYVNSQTSFNLSSLYAGARVTYTNSDIGQIAWQKLIDDNPESAVTIAPSQDNAGVSISYSTPVPIERISVMAAPGAKGRLDFYLIGGKGAPTAAVSSAASQYIRTAYSPDAGAAASGIPLSVANMTPTASIVMDGANPRGNIEFPPVTASQLLVRWTPDSSDGKITLAEIDSFSDITLADHQLVTAPEAVAENTGDSSKDGNDYKGGKEALPPVGEFLPNKTPFVPYTLGDPQNTPLGTPVPQIVEGPVSP